MNFKEWLKEIEEVTTSTGDIAVFARPIGTPVERTWPDQFATEEEKDVRRNRSKKSRKKER